MDKIQTCIDRFEKELLNLHKVFVSQEKIDYKYFDFSNAIKVLIEEVTIANEQEKYKTVIAQYIHTLVQVFVMPYCVMKMEVKIDDVKMIETITTTKYYPMGNKQPEKKVTINEFDVEELELKKEVANSITEDNPCVISESLYRDIRKIQKINRNPQSLRTLSKTLCKRKNTTKKHRCIFLFINFGFITH